MSSNGELLEFEFHAFCNVYGLSLLRVEFSFVGCWNSICIIGSSGNYLLVFTFIVVLYGYFHVYYFEPLNCLVLLVVLCWFVLGLMFVVLDLCFGGVWCRFVVGVFVVFLFVESLGGIVEGELWI